MKKNYVLNDLEYDDTPLRIMIPPEVPESNEEELKKSIEKNKELIDKMRNDKRYKELMSAL